MRETRSALSPAVFLLLALLTITGLLAPTVARADIRTLTVFRNATGTDNFSTIQQAIDRAAELIANPGNANTSFRIFVKADRDHPYNGPIIVKNSNVPIIGERTADTIISGGAQTLITVNNLSSVEIRNFTIKNATTGISVGNSSVTITNNVFQLGTANTAIQVVNSPSTSIINNTFFQNNVAINTNSDITITNNIFSGSTKAISSQITLNNVSYNDHFPSTNSGLATLDVHSIPNSQVGQSDPKFVDENNGDFHLASDSPAKGSGNPTYLNSFDHSTSDMGAYGGPNADIPAPPTVTGLNHVLTTADTATIALTWTPSTSTQVTRYRVYYGTATGNYNGTQATEGPSPILVSGTSTGLTGLPIAAPAPTAAPQVSVIPTGQSQTLQVSWSAVNGATGYRITYVNTLTGVSNNFTVAGDVTTTLLTGLTDKTPYSVTVTALAQVKFFIAVTAVINSSITSSPGGANESAYSSEDVVTIGSEAAGPDSTPQPGTPEAAVPFPNLKGEGCFIATAAYGFYSAPQVQALRDFRDRYLMTNAPGRAFVAWYYHYGPYAAHFINAHPWLKPPVRLALLPLIIAALVLTGSAPLAKASIIVLSVLWLVVRRNTKRTITIEKGAAIKTMLILSLILLPSVVQAQEPRPDRPHWSLELKGGVLFPAASNWSRFYGSDYQGQYGGAISYKILRQLEVGLGGSYSTASGKGVLPLNQTLAGDVTLELAPLDVFVLGRAIFNEDQWLVPYAGVGYTRLFFRQEVKGQGTTEGSVNGFHVRGGLQVLLDGLERSASRSLYQDFGIHHTYIFVEGKYLDARADTNPNGTVNLGGTSALGGFLFEF